ncbi:pseudouridine synthase family protein [Chitinimonas naiadis]
MYTHPVLYRDEQLVAIHKPSGLLVHRSEIDRRETRFALQEVRDQLGQRVHAIHRLDKGTSGILLFGLDADSARAVSRQFEAGSVDKRYLAIVRGWPDSEGEIDHALSRQYDDYERAPDTIAPPQDALTRFKRLATIELPHSVDRYPSSRYALLELDPVTGRRHQLRRHLKHLSHPIIGDATYGKGRHNRLFTELYGSQRLLLACTRLAFDHPVSGTRVTVDAPLADEFQTLCETLGWAACLPAQ